MTITIELTEDEERAIREAARQRGLSEEAYMRQRALDGAVPGAARTGADIVAYWDRIGLPPFLTNAEDSVDFADRLRREDSDRRWNNV